MVIIQLCTASVQIFSTEYISFHLSPSLSYYSINFDLLLFLGLMKESPHICLYGYDCAFYDQLLSVVERSIFVVQMKLFVVDKAINMSAV